MYITAKRSYPANATATGSTHPSAIQPPHPPSPTPSTLSEDIGWINSWIDEELLSFLQAHYDIPISELDNLALNVSKLMDQFEDPENDERFVESAVYAAINRKEMEKVEKVENYVWVAAVLVDWRERHNDSRIEDLQRLG
jgi:hypothetical protein